MFEDYPSELIQVEVSIFSILHVLRAASIDSKHLACYARDGAAQESEKEFKENLLSIDSLMYLATLGGAVVSNLEDRIEIW